MEVHLTREQEERIAKLATSAGTEPEVLVKDVVERFLDDEARFLEAVERGFQAAERGEFVEEEEMDVRVEKMFRKS